ncbi:thioredoxin [Candidatus Dojkabacteria bacterium]|nr:thioredoxin [Candidatus Dojkabacteria bacterium]
MADSVTDQNFDEAIKSGVTLVDFWAPWCGPCQMLGPVIEEIATELKDKANVYKLNVDDNPNISGRFNVMSIPTIMLFKDGEVVDTMIGVQHKDAYVNAIKKAIGE